MLDERLRALAEVISEGFMQIRDGCLTMSNTPLAKAAGRGGVSLRGMKVSDLFLETEEGLPGPQGPGVMECTLRTSDGRDREVVCRRVWSDASCEDWLVDDVTDRRDVERELLRTGRDLARSNRELEAVKDQLRSERTEREELLSVVSHELRTPLTVVNGYIRLLLSEDAGALNEDGAYPEGTLLDVAVRRALAYWLMASQSPTFEDAGNEQSAAEQDSPQEPPAG